MQIKVETRTVFIVWAILLRTRTRSREFASDSSESPKLERGNPKPDACRMRIVYATSRQQVHPRLPEMENPRSFHGVLRADTAIPGT
ncbi:hypothetical protein Q31a_61120 [Aureliella helgolandensis]|uniref:Uncharacterized protein n=1 Tax=Aureliella helgolandensis TaxID=2527968 RepID=A0A518GGK7_9BACT|nr:hypothetical protein Q31a_61120 [Aureliella helgolandensis]